MSALDPRTAYELSTAAIDERLEQLWLEQKIRAARPHGRMIALRHAMSAQLVRLSGWVHPDTAGELDTDSALMRLAR